MGEYEKMNATKSKIKIIVLFAIMLGICIISSKVHAFSLTLTPQPDKNAIQLDWDSPEGDIYKVWQLKPGAVEYQSISTMDVYTTTEICQVLNVYPNCGELISFTTYDGENISIVKAGNTKKWMEEPNEEDPKGYGRGLIEVTPVRLADFNANPWTYIKDANGNYKIDVIYIGHWDACGKAGISDAAASAIEQFIKDGLGVLMRT